MRKVKALNVAKVLSDYPQLHLGAYWGGTQVPKILFEYQFFQVLANLTNFDCDDRKTSLAKAYLFGCIGAIYSLPLLILLGKELIKPSYSTSIIAKSMRRKTLLFAIVAACVSGISSIYFFPSLLDPQNSFDRVPCVNPSQNTTLTPDDVSHSWTNDALHFDFFQRYIYSIAIAGINFGAWRQVFNSINDYRDGLLQNRIVAIHELARDKVVKPFDSIMTTVYANYLDLQAYLRDTALVLISLNWLLTGMSLLLINECLKLSSAATVKMSHAKQRSLVFTPELFICSTTGTIKEEQHEQLSKLFSKRLLMLGLATVLSFSAFISYFIINAVCQDADSLSCASLTILPAITMVLICALGDLFTEASPSFVAYEVVKERQLAKDDAIKTLAEARKKQEEAAGADTGAKAVV